MQIIQTELNWMQDLLNCKQGKHKKSKSKMKDQIGDRTNNEMKMNTGRRGRKRGRKKRKKRKSKHGKTFYRIKEKKIQREKEQ